MRFFRILTIVLLTALSACGLAFADFPSQQENIFAGEFRGYDALVPVGNYNFVRGVILVFGNRWAAPARSYEELNQQIWDQLLLSYEAFRRGINVDKDTLDQEIEKVLNAEKINFDWKKNPKAYAKWVQDKLKEPPEVFENQLRHLLQIENLRKTIMESASIKVSEEEAFREFLNEYNTLEL